MGHYFFEYATAANINVVFFEQFGQKIDLHTASESFNFYDIPKSFLSLIMDVAVDTCSPVIRELLDIRDGTGFHQLNPDAIQDNRSCSHLCLDYDTLVPYAQIIQIQKPAYLA